MQAPKRFTLNVCSYGGRLKRAQVLAVPMQGVFPEPSNDGRSKPQIENRVHDTQDKQVADFRMTLKALT